MTRRLLQYQIDAFTDRPFRGNPAAVILTGAPLSEELMQALAEENNLSETAYLVPRSAPGHYDLRWFTPTTEIEFCGHATIASAHALAAEHRAQTDDDRAYVFHTRIGALHAGANLYLVFGSAADVQTLTPDFTAIIALSDHGVGITAPGFSDYDCVSRFFVPAEGINEDPVTGSAHAAIGPYWAHKLGKENILAYQASARGGALHLTITGDYVDIAGPAVTVMQSEIRLPAAI